ncbi:fimbrial protein [Serratia sp. S1B]|nr:fimbrial protein [Serratia sp. S1B]
MKKNIIVATLVAAAAMTTASAFAADGTVNFTGSIIDTSCNVTNLSSGSLNVDLGSVSKASLSSAGMKSDPKAFSINVTNCPTDAVSVSFDGTSAGGNNNLLALSNSTATGVAVEITDAKGIVVPLYKSSSSYALTANAANLNFVARYVATGAVGAGTANATADFTINYN